MASLESLELKLCERYLERIQFKTFVLRVGNADVWSAFLGDVVTEALSSVMLKSAWSCFSGRYSLDEHFSRKSESSSCLEQVARFVTPVFRIGFPLELHWRMEWTYAVSQATFPVGEVQTGLGSYFFGKLWLSLTFKWRNGSTELVLARYANHIMVATTCFRRGFRSCTPWSNLNYSNEIIALYYHRAFFICT